MEQFKLSEKFIDKYKRKKAPFGFNGLGELVYMRTYSRIKENGKNDEHIKGISSFDFNHLIKHGVKKKHITKEKIESISIVKLFEKYNFDINLLFIDAEGYDANIAIDLLQNSNFKPIIVIEYVHVPLSTIKNLNNLLTEKNYRYFRINENLICIPKNITISLEI